MAWALNVLRAGAHAAVFLLCVLTCCPHTAHTACAPLQDVGQNQLTGSIPATMEFGQFELIGLNVAYNNLSGAWTGWV